MATKAAAMSLMLPCREVTACFHAIRVAAALAATILPSTGCGKAVHSRDPLAQLAAELDAAVAACKAGAGGAAAPIRAGLSSEISAARALAAQAAGAARDWESMPALISLLDDDDRVVRGRAATSIAELLGRDYQFDPDAPAAERTAIRERIVASYQAMISRPPRSQEL